MRAATKAAVQSEECEQKVLASYLDALGLVWCHVPNEIHADVRYLSKRRRLGVKPGVPDVLIFSRPPRDPAYVGVAIELKADNQSRKATVEQRLWLDWLKEAGWAATLCPGADDAIDYLRGLGFERHGPPMAIPGLDAGQGSDPVVGAAPRAIQTRKRGGA